MKKISQISSNYIGTPERWNEFLVNWSKLRLRSYALLLKQEKISWEVSEGLIEQDPMRFQLKSAQEMRNNLMHIEEYEAKHQMLPKSYRDFLIATNGDVPSWFFYDDFFGNQEERYETKIYSINQLGDICEREEAFYFRYIQDELKRYEKSDEKYYEIYQYNPNINCISNTLEFPANIAEEYYCNLLQHEMRFYTKSNITVQYAMHGFTQSRRVCNNLLKIGETSINDDFFYFLLLPNEVSQDGEWEAYSMGLPEPVIGRYISFVYLVICKFMSQVTPYISESQIFKDQYYKELGCDPRELIDLLIKKI